MYLKITRSNLEVKTSNCWSIPSFCSLVSSRCRLVSVGVPLPVCSLSVLMREALLALRFLHVKWTMNRSREIILPYPYPPYHGCSEHTLKLKDGSYCSVCDS